MKKNIMILLVCLLLFACAPIEMQALPTQTVNTYYVSQSGNNTDGRSWATAWTSLGAVNSVQDNSTIYIAGGTYTGTLRIPAGTDGLTITGYDDVILDGGGSTAYGISISAQGTPVRNLTISNLTFRNYTGAGVYGDGQNSGGLQNITVDNCKFA